MPANNLLTCVSNKKFTNAFSSRNHLEAGSRKPFFFKKRVAESSPRGVCQYCTRLMEVAGNNLSCNRMFPSSPSGNLLFLTQQLQFCSKRKVVFP
ncbi:hypothetical protein CDAR_26631 [Caerostris darwini]|uniref:Uncharacterized protein n=1 Tax=Caerostris darwini TaxID=1538125 RepID=A0AAV4QJV3_9ARAC|nr:hypothetical protein CDAR_26631 [Caerostris darwini]